MIKLYFKKLIWLIVYVVFGFGIFAVMALFLNPFLSPAFILIFSFVVTFMFVTSYTIRNRYPDGALKRAYLAETESFNLKTEIMKVLRFEHFIAELLVYITFGIIIVTIAFLRVETISVLKLLWGTIKAISMFTIPFTIIDIVFWLLIRYRWYKEKKDLLCGKRKKRSYAIYWQKEIVKSFVCSHFLCS